MKVAILALLLGVAVNGLGAWREYTGEGLPGDITAEFKDWMEAHDKSYSSVMEETRRMEIFQSNWELVNQHNAEYEQGLHTWTMAVNKFADMSEAEFVEYARCLHSDDSVHAAIEPVEVVEDENPVAAPSSLDWTDVNGKSYVTPVKDQGQCGSCWAFSAVGAMESAAAIAYGKTGSSITELSEQQVVDCTYPLRDGCNGGFQTDAFSYAIGEGGLCTESEYSYTAKGGSCKETTCGSKYDTMRTYHTVSQSESALVNAIAIGPVSVTVDAAGTGWQFYSGGVYSGNCGTSLDHAVLAVGYGYSSSGGDYWKIKNSWGTGWGDKGYIYLCRNCNKAGGQCGVLLENSYPSV